MKFLIAQQYVEENMLLSESDYAKVVFMDPSKLNEALSDLMTNQEELGGISGNSGGVTPFKPKPDLSKSNDLGNAG
ncbi:MAG: hypothetical protein ACFBSC_06265 [Microcoleaceae cyanobacterium]